MSTKGERAGAALVALRYAKQTAEQRSEAARHAALMRWGNKPRARKRVAKRAARATGP